MSLPTSSSGEPKALVLPGGTGKFGTNLPFLPTQVQLWAQPVYPSLHTDQQVLMIAFRWSQHVESINNLFEVRANLKCDQHFVYSDPHLATQDILYVPSTKHPDDR